MSGYRKTCGSCQHFDTEFETGYYGDSSAYAKCQPEVWT